VIICTIGVAWLAAPRRLGDIVKQLGDPAALMGVVAGGGFALAAVGIRLASNSLDDGSTWSRALVTLVAMLGIQTALNGAQLFVTARDDIAAVVRHWRLALPVGVLSLCGSAGWATAVTLTSAARVRTLGQVEVVIAFAVSILTLGERHSRNEYLASALVLIGVLGVVIFG
jgi:drug/metabolite transporter (DMT)-like permease